MKITVIGGGPGGLYFSLLMKKARPDCEIAIYERNRPNDTFGWGVVFSDETLSNFLEADRPTYERITEGFVHWDAIDVCYRDEVVRSGGHGFSGIARRRLLQILQERCVELGIELRFETEVEGHEQFADSDLVVAADGPPAGLVFGLPDLASRLKSGATFRVHALDDEGRLCALQMRARFRGFELPDETGRYLLARVGRGVAELFQLLDQLDRAALAAQKQLTIPFVRQVLGG